MPESLTRSVIVEKEFPHPPAKLWRALTESSLIEQWMMANNFEPIAGRPFALRTNPVGDWSGLIECRVIAIEPLNTLTYSWDTMGLETVVTFTLTETDTGTLLRVEQAGFAPDREANIKGAKYGWQSMLGKLEKVISANA